MPARLTSANARKVGGYFFGFAPSRPTKGSRNTSRNTAIPTGRHGPIRRDRKSTRLNSSHLEISYAVFCLKKKRPNAVATYMLGWPLSVVVGYFLRGLRDEQFGLRKIFLIFVLFWLALCPVPGLSMPWLAC